MFEGGALDQNEYADEPLAEYGSKGAAVTPPGAYGLIAAPPGAGAVITPPAGGDTGRGALGKVICGLCPAAPPAQTASAASAKANWPLGCLTAGARPSAKGLWNLSEITSAAVSITCQRWRQEKAAIASTPTGAKHVPCLQLSTPRVRC